jgi:CHAT domain-containing protein
LVGGRARTRPGRRARLFLASALAALAGGSGCRSQPDPETLFAEAERLRARHEKAASQRALECYRGAVAAWGEKGRTREAALASQRIGETSGQLGLLHDSLRAYLEALPLARRSGDRRLESQLLSGLGMAQALVAEREEEFEQARGRCETALQVAREAGGPREEAMAQRCLGDVAYYRQSPELALECYGRAARLWEGLGDLRGRAETLRLQGAVYSDLSHLDRAHACYEGALALWTSLGDERERAIALILEARLQVRRGRYQEGLTKFERALALLEPTGDAVWEGSSLTGIATVYRDMGEPASSLEYWERALRLFEGAGLRNVAADVLLSLGETYLGLGDDGRALDRFERALDLADGLAIPRWRAHALRYIGVIHLFRQRPEQALRHFELSQEVQRSLEDDRLEGRTFADSGEARALMGQHERALEEFDRALARSRVAGDRVARARAHFGLARSSLGLGDLDAARRHVEQSLAVAESLRTDVDDRDLRASYAASVYRYNEFQMEVLMRLQKARPGAGLAGAAFEASERARARSLLDTLAEARVDLRGGMDPGLVRREQELRRAFADWAERRGRPAGVPGPPADAAAPARQYQELERRYRQLQAEIRSRSPRYAALARPRPLRLREIQREVLDSGTLLLEYALGEDRSYLWAVTRDGLSAHELPPRAEVEGAARRAYDRLTARLSASGALQDRRRQLEQADAEYWTEAARLSATLLGPVATKMAGKRILVVADGALLYLPFAALPVPGKSEPVPMVVEHEIVNVPSASVLAVLRRETKGRTPPEKLVAVLADPVFEADDPRLPAAGVAAAVADAARGGSPGYARLAATRQEADAIVALAPGGMARRAVGLEASRATAMSPDLAQYRIVHFATHGVFDNETPGLSGVVLSLFGERGQAQDGVLRLHDIYELHLPAELVVLSACNTALGKPVRGEGLVGIVRGFMYAGAKRVVASLWKVDDLATGEMMKRFYRGMLEEGLSPAAALRQAQVSLWRQEWRRSPYYWAAFVLQGEWRRRTWPPRRTSPFSPGSRGRTSSTSSTLPAPARPAPTATPRRRPATSRSSASWSASSPAGGAGTPRTSPWSASSGWRRSAASSRPPPSGSAPRTSTGSPGTSSTSGSATSCATPRSARPSGWSSPGSAWRTGRPGAGRRPCTGAWTSAWTS